jgi:ADP-heptose:LPS heptosyltransferase
MSFFRPPPMRKAVFLSRTHLGDFLMSVPGVRLFKEHAPDCRVTVMLQQKYQDILKLDGIIDDTFDTAFASRKFFNVVRSWMRLYREHGFDTVIFHRIGSPDFPALVAACLCGIPRRLGGAEKGMQALLTHAYFPDRRERLPFYQFNIIAHFFGLPDSAPEQPLHWPVLCPPRPQPKTYDVLLAPFAQHSKIWLEESWRAFFAYLETRQVTVALLGSPDQRSASEALLEGVTFIDNLVGRTDLVDMFSLVAAARCVVSIDTGIRHIAAISGIPCVNLGHGQLSPEILGTYVPTERFLLHPVPCLPCAIEPCPLIHLRCVRGITVAQVIAAFEDVFGVRESSGAATSPAV